MPYIFKPNNKGDKVVIRYPKLTGKEGITMLSKNVNMKKNSL